MELLTRIFCCIKLTLLFAFYFTLSIVAGILLITLRFLLRPFPKWKISFTRCIKHYWLILTMSLFQFYFPFPVYVAYNKEIVKSMRNIILSNHVTNWDWLILLVILRELEMYDELCIIMKYSLSKIPIYGYGMKCFGYIFLKRNWQEDTFILTKALDSIQKKDKFHLLLFPEGTFLDDESFIKSLNFALKTQIKVDNQIYKPYHSLIPRTRGIDKIYSQLSKKLDGLIDVTLFITPYRRYLADEYSFENVVFNNNEKPQFFVIMDLIEKSDDKDWLYKLYFKKEKLLNELVDLKDNIEKIRSLEEFSFLFNNLLQEKYHVLEKKIWTRFFFINFVAFLSIWVINLHFLIKLIRI